MNPKPKTAKGFSLRFSLIGIVVGCWLLPMALTLAPLAWYTTRSVRRQFDETVRASISSAAAACRRSISAAVDSSRNASYDGRIRASYLRYKENGSRQVLYESLSSYLSQNYRYNDNFMITMVFLTEAPAEIYYTFNPLLASYSGLLEYQRDAHEDVLKITETLGTGVAFANVGGNVYIIRNIVDSAFNPFATIVSKLNLDAVLGSFRNIVWETDAVIYLNGVPVNALLGASGMEFPDERRLFPGEQAVVETADALLVYGRESTDAVDIRYAVEVDMRGFMRGFFDFNETVYTLLFMTVPLLVLAIWFFYRNIFKPIGRLINTAGEIQEGRLGAVVAGGADNREFNYLYEAINNMSIRLKRQFERIYSEELALRDARIMALQSQINPHFLNNTLEIINWEVRLGNNAKVSKMIESLSIMLDAAMDRNRSPVVTLAQELMYVDAYLYIISERFGKRLKVVKRIDDELLRHTVPRLIMQPIIENAVEHGVDKKQAGVIELSAETGDGGMLLAVTNNSPMTEKDKSVIARLLSDEQDAQSAENRSLHLGIRNVHLRLKMIYGDKSGLSITSDVENTRASFFVPFEEL